MGISSRDYVRESSGRTGGWGDDTPACKWLIITTVVVFVLQLVVVHRPDPRSEGFGLATSYIDDWFALSLDDLKTGQIWRLVSYAFLHSRADLWHLLFNMLGLWWFGSEMERLYGSREFVWFYLVSAAVAGLGFCGWQLATLLPNQPATPMVGASGAVLAAMTLYATHYPREKIGLFYGLIFVEVRWVVALYVAMDLIPVIQTLQGERVFSNVAHAAHLLGVLFGWLYRHYHWHLSSRFDLSWISGLPKRVRQSQVKKNLRVFEPEAEPETDLEGELDRILAKIHEHGSASLTDREQKVLTRASQQYKNRQ